MAKLKVSPVGSNMTEVQTAEGHTVLFSYETPVAALTKDGRVIKTTHKWSKTTSSHINKWLNGLHVNKDSNRIEYWESDSHPAISKWVGTVEQVSQSELDNLI